MQKSERKIELLVLMLTVAGIALLLQNAQIAAGKFVGKGIGPMLFPQIILSIMLFLSMIRMVVTIRYLVYHRKQQDEKKQRDIRTIATYLLIVVYALLWNVLGFSVSTFIYIIAQSFVLKRDVKLLQTVLIALLISVVMYLFFAELFYVNFPEPILEYIFG